MAGWGDDPVLEALRGLLAEGWAPVALAEGSGRNAMGMDEVTVQKGDERRTLRSDHIAFHRFVEGLAQDYPGLNHRP